MTATSTSGTATRTQNQAPGAEKARKMRAASNRAVAQRPRRPIEPHRRAACHHHSERQSGAEGAAAWQPDEDETVSPPKGDLLDHPSAAAAWSSAAGAMRNLSGRRAEAVVF